MNREISYRTLRVVIGVIAVFLSPMVYVVSGFNPLKSISDSYWTDARDVFVGSLAVVGFFLSAYNGDGLKKGLEFYLSKFACVFALCVALFPTSDESHKQNLPWWVNNVVAAIGYSSERIHLFFAVLLFICLIIIMWFFSIRARNKGKRVRAFYYRLVVALMVVGGLAIKLPDSFFWSESKYLYVEVWELTLFGLGWFAAGTYKK
ncbi:hypothetical protein GJV06_07870 [Enterobacteriaceae bacterium RIT691]|nr:hypothetical protein [Enterobacteriaceae bacterium RIT691]